MTSRRKEEERSSIKDLKRHAQFAVAWSRHGSPVGLPAAHHLRGANALTRQTRGRGPGHATARSSWIVRGWQGCAAPTNPGREKLQLGIVNAYKFRMGGFVICTLPRYQGTSRLSFVSPTADVSEAAHAVCWCTADMCAFGLCPAPRLPSFNAPRLPSFNMTTSQGVLGNSLRIFRRYSLSDIPYRMF